MINNDKVKLMTKIQLFENHEQSALKANRFFRKDYLGLYLIRSFLAYTILFFMILTVIFLYNWEEVLTGMELTALIQAGEGILFSFFLLLIPCMIVSYIVYWSRYKKFKRRIKEHMTNLKQLNGFYLDSAE